MRRYISTVFLPFLLFISGCGKNVNESVQSRINKFHPVELSCDLSRLHASDRAALKLLVKASQRMDSLFLHQVSENNSVLLADLLRSRTREGADSLSFFRLMFGPWDRLEGDEPVLTNRPKPLGANFYPEDMDRAEFESWLKAHPGDREAFEGNFTVIRRRDGVPAAIPYSEFYRDQLESAAEILHRAARTTKDPSLAAYLESRARAFMTNDYFDSDVKWMDLSGDVEVVIGPYEVYEDRLFGYKAAFEAFLCVVDRPLSDKQREIIGTLDAMEKALPLPPEYQRYSRGKASPIKVVDLVYSAGDTKAGVQTTAFNLPNDERVRQAKGSKKVMLKNVMRAKFETCWIPIVQAALAPQDLRRVSFDAYFYETLMHEISHGLGPGQITVGGQETTVNKALKDQYSVVEECKADVLGLLNTQFLIDHGILPRSLEHSLYATTLGGMFRSIRFGIEEAHGGGVAIQLNHYLDQGAFRVEPDGRFSVDDARMKASVASLAAELLLIQAKGDYEGAKAFVQKNRFLRPEVAAALKKLEAVPVDIRPVYPIEGEIPHD